MDDFVQFLSGQVPWGDLPPDTVAAAVTHVQVEFFARGTALPAACIDSFLVIVRTGCLEARVPAAMGGGFVGRLGEGGCLESLSHDDAVRPDVLAVEDTLAYLVPRHDFQGLLSHPSFERHFRGSGTEGLRIAKGEDAELRLRDLPLRSPVSCQPDASIAEAALRMREADEDSIVIVGNPIGIVTDRDLRNQVVAGGMPAEAPISAIMMAPCPSLSLDASILDALELMLAHGMTRVPVMEAGRLSALLTDEDLMRVRSPSPLLLSRLLSGPVDLSRLDDFGSHARATVEFLLRSGFEPSAIGKIMASVHDNLVRHLVREGCRVLGDPPNRFCWLVPGILGRRDPMLQPMQEHAIAYSDRTTSANLPWFASLARFVSEGLGKASFQKNPTHVVATNPLWCRPVSSWRQYFDDWSVHPDGAVASQACPFFDTRAVAGNLDLHDELNPALRAAGNSPAFRLRLARVALQEKPPLGFFRNHLLESDGTATDHLDLNRRILHPIVSLARLVILETGHGPSNTVARLMLAQHSSFLEESVAKGLVLAYEWAYKLELQRQIEADGSDSGNLGLDPARLDAKQRALLVECFRTLAIAQQGLRNALGTSGGHE